MTAIGVQQRLEGLSPARLGLAIYLLAGLVFIAADTLTKGLVANAPVVDVIFGRHLVAFGAVVLLAGRGRPRRRLLVTRRPALQLIRGLAMFGTTVIFFLSLSLLPIGTVSALSNTNPLIVLLLAGPLLGERVSRAAALGGIIGFAGVLAITGIDVTAFDARMLVPLSFGFVYAVFSILSRSLKEDDSHVTVFWSAVVCLVAGTVLVLAIPTETTPDLVQWLGIALLGIMALTGHWLLVAAFRRTPASDLAPLGYIGVLWSFIVGATIFGEAMQPGPVVGALLIAAGGILALRSASAEDEVTAAPALDRGDSADLVSREPPR